MAFREDMQQLHEDMLTTTFPQARRELEYRDNAGIKTPCHGGKFNPKYSERDGEAVKSSSAKFSIAQNVLTLEPVVGHIIYVNVEDREYMIARVDTDPVDAVWSIYGNS